MEQNFQNKFKPLVINIEGEMYEWHKQYITGAEIKKMANIPLEKDIYLSLTDPWDDELVANDASVNLARPGIENFFIKKKLKFFIDEKPFEWHSQYIKGEQIRKLGKIGPDYDLFLKIPDPYKNELIANDNKVDLARPGIEHFFSKEKPFEKVVIIVNGREKEWSQRSISFIDVVHLAFGTNVNCNTAYTVTYSRGPKQNPEGSMVKGDNVVVKHKMIFNVTATNKS